MTTGDVRPLRALIEQHRKGRSWPKLGDLVGMSGKQVGNWADGKVEKLPVYQFDVIADALGIDRAEFLAAGEASRAAYLADQAAGSQGAPPELTGDVEDLAESPPPSGRNGRGAGRSQGGKLTMQQAVEVAKALIELRNVAAQLSESGATLGVAGATLVKVADSLAAVVGPDAIAKAQKA